MFNIPQRKEGADSILGEPEESEDEVFGTHPGGRRNPPPPLDLPPTLAGPLVAPPQPAPPPAVSPSPSAPPPDDQRPDLFPDPEPVGAPAASTSSQPLPDAPDGTANPFADFNPAAAAPPGPATGPRPTAPEEEPAEEHPPPRNKRELGEPDEEEKPPRAGRGRAPAKAGGISPVVLILVAGYALVATALAAYGLFFKSSDRPDTGHPLSTVPDNFGEFDPATRKKVTQYKFPVDGPLPAAQRAKLGEKIAIDDVEIEPRKIEKRRLELRTEGTSGEVLKEWSRGPALVLTLLIKNTSPDLSLYPMDPAFTRRASGSDQPITRLVVNRKTVFAGGAIPWPFGDKVKRRLDVQQENDYVPLRPGEAREYVVFTDARPDIVNAVEGAKGEMEWRVQVRRGPVEYRGKEVPVTAVVGVEFTAADVH